VENKSGNETIAVKCEPIINNQHKVPKAHPKLIENAAKEKQAKEIPKNQNRVIWLL